MTPPARVKNQIERRPLYLIIGGECHYLQYSNVHAWKGHLGYLDAERANIERRSVSVLLCPRNVNRSRRWLPVTTPVRASRLRMLPAAPSQLDLLFSLADAPSHPRPRIDLRHYWARVRSEVPRAVWPRWPGRPRASWNGKLQAPESAFESRHLRPSWSAPPCGP